ncbi:hypothetical protein CSE45_2214 [Citreicella sp. SE45]|nr:hypothetical protein CSE45_2214 [Citreicella sp. SE45]
MDTPTDHWPLSVIRALSLVSGPKAREPEAGISSELREPGLGGEVCGVLGGIFLLRGAGAGEEPCECGRGGAVQDARVR